jgi:aspartokinase-like uncharacterized kinase
MLAPLTVVKVGGSLYDLPDLAIRVREWLIAELNSGFGALLVPGGGLTADAVRTLDRCHGLGEEKAHWLALHAMSLNAHFLTSLLPFGRVIEDENHCQRVWLEGDTPILDTYSFACADEERPSHLPHSWAVTSDALAARVAVVLQASELVLLKSTTIPPGLGWREAGRLGLVDAAFADVLRSAPPELRVRAVNLRTWPE